MLTKDYSIEIKASAQRVWYALWDDAHYRLWTAAFTEGSYAITDHWKEGSRVHFMAPDGKGMFSDVSENKPYERMTFTHIGEIKNFEEQELNAETRSWSGGKERYLLTEKDGHTTLLVSVDIHEAFGDYFDKAFPLALAYAKELAENLMIIAQTTLQVPLEKAWEKWTNPADIMAWNYANSDWHCPRAANDLRAGAKFNYRMEAKDGSFGFDFEGTYSNITPHELIEYSLADGRKVTIEFKAGGDQTEVIQKFEPETVNPFDLQRDGWQAIMNNYKVHAEK